MDQPISELIGRFQQAFDEHDWVGCVSAWMTKSSSTTRHFAGRIHLVFDPTNT